MVKTRYGQSIGVFEGFVNGDKDGSNTEEETHKEVLDIFKEVQQKRGRATGWGKIQRGQGLSPEE